MVSTLVRNFHSLKYPVDHNLAHAERDVRGFSMKFYTEEGNDDYIQDRALFNLFDEGQKARPFSNIAEAMQGVPQPIIKRQLGHFEKVHPDYAAGVRQALEKMK